VAAILAATRLLQRSSELFRSVLAKFFLESRRGQKFSAVTLDQRGFEWLMSSQRVQEKEKIRLVG
jgi:hypothetical protein